MLLPKGSVVLLINAIDIFCLGSFYVRSLIRDIGERLGCCAHVTDTLRTSEGQFKNSNSLLDFAYLTYEDILHQILSVEEVENRKESLSYM